MDLTGYWIGFRILRLARSHDHTDTPGDVDEQLLWRLFHEDEARVLPAEAVAFRCPCDAGRIANVLRSYSDSDREGLADPDGVIRARCEFCGRVHLINPRDLRQGKGA